MKKALILGALLLAGCSDSVNFDMKLLYKAEELCEVNRGSLSIRVFGTRTVTKDDMIYAEVTCLNKARFTVYRDDLK